MEYTEAAWRELLTFMGNRHFDFDKFWASEDGKYTQETSWFFCSGEHSDEEIDEYWLNYEKGLIREIHGTPDDPVNHWMAFIPKSSKDDPGRKYPFTFLLHGAGNPISMTQIYGIVQLAAKEEIIVIAPENERDDSLFALLAYAKNNYPVDASRIYSMGVSFGAMRSSSMAIRYPEVFAGVGMNGMLNIGENPIMDLSGVHYPEVRVTSDHIRHAAELGLCCAEIVGDQEFPDFLPVYASKYYLPPELGLDLSAAMKTRYVDSWQTLSGRNPKGSASKYPEDFNDIENLTGIAFDRTETRNLSGRNYYIGDFINSEDDCRFRFIAVEDLPHTPPIHFAELAWEIIGKYRRNLVTGKLEIIC